MFRIRFVGAPRGISVQQYVKLLNYEGGFNFQMVKDIAIHIRTCCHAALATMRDG